MNSQNSISNLHAKSALILGHTTSGMGERVLAYKMQKLLEDVGISTQPIIDIIELMGENYEPFALLNYELANGNFSMIGGLDTLSLPSTDILLILSWSFSLAALFGTNIQNSCPIIAKLYAHHRDERILPKLYTPADLLITESLLANERGSAYGIDLGKMLYLPHIYLDLPITSQKHEKRRVIGTVSRLEYGKNCEFAIEAVRRLALKGHEVVLILKGDFPEESPYPEYKPLLEQMLDAYKNEPWLIWDRKPTAFPDVLEEYSHFDVLLHPSGAEGGSHIIVECLGLGIPCVVLNCSTNPFLFKGLATFVNTQGKERRGAQLPFYIPSLEDLVDKLEKELQPPDPKRVCERFHPEVARARIELLFERDFEKIAALYHKDCKVYGL